MKQITFILISFLICDYCFGQNTEAAKNYNLGNKYFKQKDFNKAIEYYTTSVDKCPDADTYFKRALSYLNIQDTCNYCKDLKLAYMYDKKDAEKKYDKICVIHDTIFEIADSIKEEFPGCRYFVITRYRDRDEEFINHFDKQNEKIESVYNTPPEFPGGDEARIKFLAQNLKYPQLAKEYGISGTVYGRFFISKNGSISKIVVIRGIGGGCDEEFVRLIKLMPRWKPATRKGIPIEVEFKMTLRFTLSD